MENISRADQQPKSGRFLAILFFAVGIFYLADWLYGGQSATYRLLAGLGFVLMAPNAYFNPINLAMPVRNIFKPQMRPNASKPAQYIGLIGLLILVAGLVVRWL